MRKSFVKFCRYVTVLMIATIAVAASASGQSLPERVKAYMTKTYPGWAIMNGYSGPDNPRTPAIASGDFNGDRRRDYAVVITKGDRKYAVVMFVTPRSINSVTLEAQKENENAWIAQISRDDKGARIMGRDSSDRERKITLSNDAVVLIDGEGHPTLYYWRGGKFETLYGVDSVK